MKHQDIRIQKEWIARSQGPRCRQDLITVGSITLAFFALFRTVSWVSQNNRNTGEYKHDQRRKWCIEKSGQVVDF